DGKSRVPAGVTVLTIQLGCVEQFYEVRAAGCGAANLLITAEAGYALVVSTEQDFRDLATTPGGRLGIYRVFQQHVGVRFFDQGFRVANDPGDQTGDGLNHHHHRDLSPVQYVVSDGDRDDGEVLTCVVDDT